MAIPNPTFETEPDEAPEYFVSIFRKIAEVPGDYLEKIVEEEEKMVNEEKRISAKSTGPPDEFARDTWEEEVDEFEPADRRTLGISPVFGGGTSFSICLLHPSHVWLG